MKSYLKTGLAIGALAATLTTGVLVGEALAAQPHMRAALDYLRNGRSELGMADRNKMGHRAEAVRLVDEAINETQLGMEEAR